jgi:hypothetical protein
VSRVNNIRTDDATWRRFRIAAVTVGMPLGGFLEMLMDVYDDALGRVRDE